jgi:hypothetical protein
MIVFAHGHNICINLVQCAKVNTMLAAVKKVNENNVNPFPVIPGYYRFLFRHRIVIESIATSLGLVSMTGGGRFGQSD